MAPKRRPDCGVCGEMKVERRGRLVCMACNRRYAAEAHRRGSYRRPRETHKASNSKWRLTVRESVLTNSQLSKTKHLYGIEEATYVSLKQSQDNRCAVCRKCFQDEILIDHDHDTRAIRGLLCRKCNFGLGLFGDDPEILMAAAAYLDGHKRIQSETA